MLSAIWLAMLLHHAAPPPVAPAPPPPVQVVAPATATPPAPELPPAQYGPQPEPTVVTTTPIDNCLVTWPGGFYQGDCTEAQAVAVDTPNSTLTHTSSPMTTGN